MSAKNKNKGISSDGPPLGGGISLGGPGSPINQGGPRAKPRFSSPASSPGAGGPSYPSSLSTNGPSSRPNSRLSGNLSPTPPTSAPTPPPNAWAQKPSFAAAAGGSRPSSVLSTASSTASANSTPAPASAPFKSVEGTAGTSEKTSSDGAPPPLSTPVQTPSSSDTLAHIFSAQNLLTTHVTVVTTKDTYDGMLVDLSRSIKQRSGSSKTHVILQNARIKGMNRDVMIREWQGPHDEIVSISKWIADASDVTPAPSAGAGGKERKLQGFQTDTDISRTAQLGQERVLVAWDAGSPPPASPALKSGLDDETFGSSSGGGGGKKGGWDQFAENERRFGTKTDFDEELYTTKLVRNGEGFKDKERKAEAMAREIMNTASSNPHMQEERGQAVNSALGEEDRYSGVVRAANAYVPPNARKAGTPTPSSKPNTPTVAPAAPAPAAPAALAQRSNSPIMDPAVVRSSSGGPNAAKAGLGPAAPPLLKVASTGGNEGGIESPSPDKSVLAAFHDFVKSDRQRLEQKKKLLDSKVKSEKDRKLKELMKFGQDFKLKTAIPEDLVPILAKDAEKQKAIVEKAAAEALAAKNAPPPTPSPKVRLTQPSGVTFSTPQAPQPIRGARSSMIISDIPPFNPNKKLGASGSPAPSSPAASITSSSGLPKMNVAAQPFVFKPTIPPFKPTPSKSPVPIVREIPPFVGTPKGTPKGATAQLGGSPSLPKAAVVPPAPSKSPLQSTVNPAPVPSSGPVNPFFGTKVPKRTSANVSVREDFNPHRLSKLASANSYPPNWPYPGRAYKASFPPMFAVDFSQEFPYGAEPSHQQQQPGLGMPGGGGPGMQPHMVSPSMMHAQPQMYGQTYGGYYQQYRFAGPQPGMPQGMPPNGNNAGPSNGAPHHANALNSSGGPNGVPQGYAQQPGGGFVPMFAGQPGQPGGHGGPPGGPQGPYAMGPVMISLPPGGMYTPIPGYQGQPGQQMAGGPFVNGGPPGGRGAPMGYYPMQGGQMQSPQMGHVYQQQFMGGQPPPHFSVVPQPGQPGGPAPGTNDGQH